MNFNKLTLIFFVAFCCFFLNAQYTDLYAFEKGNHLVGVNVGIKIIGNKTAVSAFYEYGLTHLFVEECMLGGGFFGGYYKEELGKEFEKIYITGIMLNVHYQFVDRLDTYVGFTPNFNIRTYEIDKNRAKFNCYAHVGGRFYLTNRLGVFAEMSTGFNNFSGGLSVKI